MLPEKLRNLKKSMQTGHFKIAFQKRADDNKEYVNSSDGARHKFHQQMAMELLRVLPSSMGF